MLRKGKHAQNLGHCGQRPRAVEISNKIPSRMFLYIPSRVIWKDTGLMEKLQLSLNAARETETLTFTTAHSFKQPICQTRLNITPGTTVFSFLVFDFKWNDSFLIVCHNPKSVVSDFNSNWTHTHTQAHAHARTHAHTCSHEQTNAHVHACIQSCSRGGGWLPSLCESDKATCKQWRRGTWRNCCLHKEGRNFGIIFERCWMKGTVFLTPLCLFNFLF